MNKSTKDRLNRTENFAVMKLIESHGKRLENGLFEYEPGWSDDRVATDLGVGKIAVSNGRREVFGKLYFKAATSNKAETDQRLNTLEVASKASRVVHYELGRRVEALERAINLLLTAPNREGLDRNKLEELRRHFNGTVTPTPKVQA